MNYGQLIDPEWVQRGAPERWPHAKLATEPRKNVRTHASDPFVDHGSKQAQKGRMRHRKVRHGRPGFSQDVRLTLMAHGGTHAAGVTCDEIVAHLPKPKGKLARRTRQQVVMYLWTLMGLGHVEAIGQKRAYRYRITQRGVTCAKSIEAAPAAE